MAQAPMRAPDGRRRRRRRSLLVAAVLGVAVAVGASLVALRALAPDDCTAESPEVVVAADPAIAPTLATALGGSQRDAEGACVRTRVVPGRAADVAQDVAAGTAPQLWVADSSTSVPLALPARTGATPLAEVGAPLARSPLVAATDPGTATGAGWPAAPPSWRSLLVGDPVPASVADPVTTGEGRGALLSLTAALGAIDPANPPVDLLSGLVRMSRTQLPDPQDAGPGEGRPVAVVTEQAAIAAAAAGRPVAIAHPVEGTVDLDYPVVRIRRVAEPPDSDRVVAAVEGALRSAPTRDALLRAGFRDPSGALAPDPPAAPEGLVAAAPATLPALPPEATEQVLALWRTFTTPFTALFVVDLSGSMAEPIPGGTNRIELAAGTLLGVVPALEPSSVVGLWGFSLDRVAGADWQEFAPLRPVSEPGPAGPHQQVLQGALLGLPGVIGGGTGLYDSALAAVREVQADYRPDRINAVLVMTDGRNSDPVGTGREELLETLRAEANPGRPVPLFTIGMGPDADLGELTAMSEATGGQAYLARDAAEVQRAFFAAFTSWTCPGGC